MSIAARVLTPRQRPPGEFEKERGRAYAIAGRTGSIFRRVPLADWITLLLLGIMLASVAWSVQLAKWGDLPSILPTILMGWAAAFLASRWRANIAIKLTVAVLLGFAIIMWQGSIPAEGSNVADRAREAWDRFWQWVAIARQGGISNDTVPFALMFMTASWVTGYTVTALTFRFRNPWAPVILLSAGLLNNLSFRPGLYEHTFFIFILASVALFAHLTTVRRTDRWKANNIRYPKSLHWLSVRDGVLFGAIVVLVAAILPLFEPRSGSLDKTWETIKSPIVALEDPASRLLAGVKAQDGSTGLAVPSNVLAFRGPIHLTPDPMMWVTSRYAVMLPGGVFETYTSSGWITDPQEKREMPAGSALFDTPLDEGRDRVDQLVQPLVETQLVLPVSGVYTVDRDTEVEYLRPPRHTIALTGSVGPLASLPEDIRDFAFQLRFALSDIADRGPSDPQFTLSTQPLVGSDQVEALIDRLAPEDVNVTLVTEGGSDRVRELIVERDGPQEQVGVMFAEPVQAEHLYKITSYVSIASGEDLAASGDDYPGWVIDRYMQLPTNLPSEVTRLANAIVREAGARTPYEKVQAVKAFLQDQEYSQEIHGPAVGVDGIYYMLFQTQDEPCPSVNPGCDVNKIKAYSQYFGSAGAVLLRAVGVPTRMIVGWGSGEYMPGVGKFLVRDQDRHGWTQVYFEDYGWVDVEMTPGREEVDPGVSYSIQPSAGVPSSASEETGEDPLPFEEDLAFLEELAARAREQFNREREAELAAQDEGSSSLPLTPFIVGGALAGVVALGYGGWVLLHRGMKPGEKAYTKMVRAGRLFGVKRQPWQTPSEYAASLAIAVPSVADSADLIALEYERERYANDVSTGKSERLGKHWRKVLSGLIGYRLRTIAGARPQLGEGRSRA